MDTEGNPEFTEAIEAALMGLRQELEDAGFSAEKIEEALSKARSLPGEGAVERGADDNGRPYRITRHDNGFEFETDADVS